jgi:gliding motility-associated-like protein
LSTPNITTFNLEEANELITTITPDITVTYHSLQTDAINGDNAIINFNNYENSVINEILYTRVTHNISGCSETGSLRLSVSNVPASTFKAEPICDEQDSPDGINLLLLEPYTGEIIKNLGLPRTNTRIKFFATIEDALLEKDEISEFTNTIPYSQSIYYRVETINNNACYSINNLELSINKLPDLEADETRYYCLNTYPEKISIGAGILDGSVTDYSYLWSTGETTPKISINSTGVYLVTVTNLDGCSKTRTITVEPSNIATFQNPPFKVKDTSANNSITVFATGQGTYQYSLIDLKGNTIQPYQDSNVFENVSPGIYTVSARDIKNNCGSRSEKVSIIGFPKFFTPNNDGVNDTWQVMGVSEMFQPNTKIQIYDRFGKLIKQLDPIGEGWNGLFNGQKLPTDDYWFSIQLQDGRIFKSHFTLKN